ncbi:MAG: tRNA lysidine(34) synthetase TilS [Cyclobacteriaceae bacterium]
MQQKFLDFINVNNLFTADEKILLAVSGGVDSVCLSHLFKQAGFKFAIAHCNFQLRAEDSEEDEAFVEALAQSLEVPFHSVKFDTNKNAEEGRISIQMAARNLRYDWFAKLMRAHGYVKLATAHHQNDNIETVLFNLAKGTGISGLRGIKKANNGTIRPLLFAMKSEILAYATKHSLEWREDISNASDKYHRNYIRQKVVPALTAINPSFEQNFSFTTDRIALAEKALAKMVDQYRERCVVQKTDHLQIDCKQIGEYALLYEILRPYGFSLRQSVDIFSDSEISGKEYFSEQYWLVKDREYLVLTEKPTERQSVLLEQDDRAMTAGKLKLNISVTENQVKILPDPAIAILDYDKLKFPLKIRDWKEGDKFRPLGMRGKKKVSDFMIDNKIPLNLKKSYRVLESAGEIVWLIGLRIDERYKINETTEKVYQIELDKNHV